MTVSALTLGLLLILLIGCRAQSLVTQEPSVTATPGQTVKLPCTLGGGLTVSANRVVFFQQKLEQVPRYLLYYFSESSKGKGAGVPDRFVGSASGSVGYLTITGVLAEDDANYYCCTWGGSAWIFGGGTQLNVLSGETKAPALNIFPPSSEEVATSKATLVCTMEDFYPGSVTVTWKADGAAISSGVETTRPSKQSGNNLFMASSFLTVPAVDWSGGKKYTCQATHESKIIEKSVKHSECV